MYTAKEMINLIREHHLGVCEKTHPDRFHTVYTVTVIADTNTTKLLERLITRSAARAKVYNASATCIFEDATIILLR